MAVINMSKNQKVSMVKEDGSSIMPEKQILISTLTVL